MAADPIVCSGNCTVSVQVAPVPLTDEQITDIGLLFGFFVSSAVIIYCLKQLLNIFKVNSDTD